MSSSHTTAEGIAGAVELHTFVAIDVLDVLRYVEEQTVDTLQNTAIDLARGRDGRQFAQESDRAREKWLESVGWDEALHPAVVVGRRQD